MSKSQNSPTPVWDAFLKEAMPNAEERAAFLFFLGVEPETAPQGRGTPRREPKE